MIVFQNVIWLLVLIGVMILIHELGHFLAARYFDVRVEIFSFGFGPRLFGFRRGDTDYRLSAILFGGYVKMAGEYADTGELREDPRSYPSKPRWQKLIIALAGPFMNMVLAVALLTGLFMVKYQRLAEPNLRAVIGHVLPESAAAKAGVKEGDRIVRMEDKDNPNWEDITLKEVASAYRPLSITIERSGQRLDKTVIPVLEDRMGVGFAGWAEKSDIQVGSLQPGMPAEKAGLKKGDLLISANREPIHSRYRLQEVIRKSEGKPVEIEFDRDGKRNRIAVQPVFRKLEGVERWMIGVDPELRLQIITTRLSFPDALTESVRRNVQSATLIYQFLRGIIERRMSARSLDGPIRIAQLSGEAAREGPSAFFHLMSMVSLNLAIFNLLPIPILDGGVILLLLIEMLMRRDLSLPVKEAVFKLGFVFLMIVVVFVLYNDISKYLPSG